MRQAMIMRKPRRASMIIIVMMRSRATLSSDNWKMRSGGSFGSVLTVKAHAEDLYRPMAGSRAERDGPHSRGQTGIYGEQLARHVVFASLSPYSLRLYLASRSEYDARPLPFRVTRFTLTTGHQDPDVHTPYMCNRTSIRVYFYPFASVIKSVCTCTIDCT